ncbi:MAG TPA: zinc metallopeptidase [Acidobacteriota bacterium]|nr:zinc metallopeptidase [Acidobacteriota bacterium]
MYLDPLYLIMLMPALLLSLWASWRVKSNFKKYSQVRSARGITGAQAAEELLRSAGIHDVNVVLAQGFLSDHYNPVNKTLALSDGVYNSASVAAVGIAAHEAGHAIQHKEKYFPLWLRSTLVPTASIGSSLGYMVMFIGLILQASGIILLGALLFSAVLVFQLVTLPVEFNASSRAKALLLHHGIISPREREGIDKVLNAAALTYVAAVVSTLMTLLYFLMRARQ